MLRTNILCLGFFFLSIFQSSLFAEDFGVSVQAVGRGSVTGTGSFQQGSNITLSATPEPGYVFIGWSGDLAGQQNPYSFQIQASVNGYAHFQKQKTEIIYIDGKPAIARSYVAKLNYNGQRSLRRRINRVDDTTVYRRNKVLDDLVRIDRDINSTLSAVASDDDYSLENFQKFSQNLSDRKSSGVTREIKQMLQSNLYEFVEPNWVVKKMSTIDPYKNLNDGWLWGLRNKGVIFPNIISGLDIHADEAWEIVGDQKGPIIAVIDTGVQYGHESLANNIWTNPLETPGDDDPDGNGYLDDVHGIDAIDQLGLGAPGNNDPGDKNGHGTMVAGIIGADGTNGFWGLAPNSTIMGLRFMNADGVGNIDDSIRCIDYAIENGAKVINASYGFYTSDPQDVLVEKAAIERANKAGIVFVAAAGNDGHDNDFRSGEMDFTFLDL